MTVERALRRHRADARAPLLPEAQDLARLAATAEPDLIMARCGRSDAARRGPAIAPTIFVPDRMPFLDHLAWLADAVGMEGDFEGERARDL